MSTYDNNKKTPEERRNSLISAVSTLLFLGLVILICAFVGMKYPDPPIPEEGVEVNLGDSDFGLGDADNPDASENVQAATPPSPSTGENVSTQKAPSAAINTSTDNAKVTHTKVQPQETPKTDAKTESPTNQKALFPGSKKNTDGGSQGVTQGSGNQGKAGGDPNSNRYDGQPGNGGAGYSLNGRKASSLPTPNYNSQKEGKIVVKIYVDRNGQVTKTTAPEKGSTIYDGALVERARNAAMKARFNADPNASETQVGTITYVFRLSN